MASDHPKRLRAVVIGAVETTRIAIEALRHAPGWDLAGVATLPPTLAARHSDFCDLAPTAAEAGARLIPAADANAPETIAAIRALEPDFLFVIGWSQVCRPPLLALCPDRAIGYHPSALPRMRGRAVVPWTILNDERITAGSLFWLGSGIDTGDILAQHFFHVAADETVTELYARHLVVLARLMDEALPRLANGTAPRLPQDERYATWCARRRPEDGRIDWDRPAAEVWRLVRAVGRPYPGAFTHAGTERLVVWAAEPWPQGARHLAAPGQVIAIDSHGFAVRCGDGGALRVTAWEGPAPRLHARLRSPA